MVVFTDMSLALQVITQIQALWDANNIDSYIYRLRIGCECLPCDTIPTFNTVTNDVVSDVEFILEDEANFFGCNVNDLFYGSSTMDTFFNIGIEFVETALARSVNCSDDAFANFGIFERAYCGATIQFEFDPTYYYPIRIIRNLPRIADLFENINIECFTSLTDGIDTSEFTNRCSLASIPTPAPTDITIAPTPSICNKLCAKTEGKPCIHLNDQDSTCFDYIFSNICPGGTIDCGVNSFSPCDICINQGNPCKHNNDNTCYPLPQNGICYAGTTLCSGNQAKIEGKSNIIHIEADASKEITRLTLVISGIIAVIIVIICIISITILIHNYYYSYKQPKFIPINTNDSEITTDAVNQ